MGKSVNTKPKFFRLIRDIFFSCLLWLTNISSPDVSINETLDGLVIFRVALRKQNPLVCLTFTLFVFNIMSVAFILR